MKKEFPLLVLLFVMSSSSLAMSFSSLVKADFTVIRVPADYPSIQMAIDVAASGSIILVDDGIYYEHLVVNKALMLFGQDSATTIIDGNGTGTVITIIADNVILDGFTICNGSRHGIYLDNSHNSTIANNKIMLNQYFGIDLYYSDYNALIDNTIMRNGYAGPMGYGGGVCLSSSDNNTVNGNTITSQTPWGLLVERSANNSISHNAVTSNKYGIALVDSNDSTINHNNFLANYQTVFVDLVSYNNTWDNGTAGNYWDDYVGLDDGSGGRVAGDGVGDTDLPHIGVDNYPLIAPSGPIPIVWENNAYPVSLLSNSTVSTFRFTQADKTIAFNVRGPQDTLGYCNVTIPKNLLRDSPWKILLNNTGVTSQAIITENQTHTSIYFTYNHSNYNVQIIGTWVVPELPSNIALSLLMILTALTLILAKKTSKEDGLLPPQS